eukprot:Hpha_TRINITY_DN16948_c1_g3::TRINITY_DN16948_c1_g3_i1::g.56991::m.56991
MGNGCGRGWDTQFSTPMPTRRRLTFTRRMTAELALQGIVTTADAQEIAIAFEDFPNGADPTTTETGDPTTTERASSSDPHSGEESPKPTDVDSASVPSTPSHLARSLPEVMEIVSSLPSRVETSQVEASPGPLRIPVTSSVSLELATPESVLCHLMIGSLDTNQAVVGDDESSKDTPETVSEAQRSQRSQISTRSQISGGSRPSPVPILSPNLQMDSEHDQAPEPRGADPVAASVNLFCPLGGISLRVPVRPAQTVAHCESVSHHGVVAQGPAWSVSRHSTSSRYNTSTVGSGHSAMSAISAGSARSAVVSRRKDHRKHREETPADSPMARERARSTKAFPSAPWSAEPRPPDAKGGQGESVRHRRFTATTRSGDVKGSAPLWVSGLSGMSMSGSGSTSGYSRYSKKKDKVFNPDTSGMSTESGRWC